MTSSPTRRRRPKLTAGNQVAAHGFTLLEMLVSVSIVAVLAILTLTGIQVIRVKAKETQCISNLRRLGAGFANYLNENNNSYFGAGPGGNATGPTYESRGYFRWPQRLGPYLDLEGPISSRTTSDGHTVQTLDNAYRHAIFHSPFTDKQHYANPGSVSNPVLGIYGINYKVISESATELNIVGINALTIARPSRTVLLGEIFGGNSYSGKSDPSPGVGLNTAGPYPGRANGPASNSRLNGNPNGDPTSVGPVRFLFADFHVKTIPLKDMRPWPGELTFDP